MSKGFHKNPKRHAINSYGVFNTPSSPIGLRNHILKVQALNTHYTPSTQYSVAQHFGTDPKLMVKLSGIMEYLFSDDNMPPEQKEYEARTYQFAYDYVRGTTKHYTKQERIMYFSNPKIKYYLNLAYIENVTPDIDDDYKRKHYLRNYNRALKEYSKFLKKKEKEELKRRIKMPVFSSVSPSNSQSQVLLRQEQRQQDKYELPTAPLIPNVTKPPKNSHEIELPIKVEIEQKKRKAKKEVNTNEQVNIQG